MSEKQQQYSSHSRDFLHRARLRLDEKRPESLVYAALELRMGIEARMQQYLEAQEEVSAKKKKGWQIAVMARNIENIFRTGDKIAAFAFDPVDPGEGTHPFTLYYTPVNTTLRKKAEQLGNYLHSAGIVELTNENKWRTFRALLEDIYEELRRANIGTLLGVPLLSPEKKLRLFLELAPGERAEDVMSKLKAGTIGNLHVQYLDVLPEPVLNSNRFRLGK